jgi:hypothetical protein
VRSGKGKLLKNDNNGEEVMKINKTAALAIILGAFIAGTVNAQKPKTFEEAKSLSASQDRLLLMEFFREG